jgi:NADH:ubiquinone oxidoreductase subunit F (NADH-binding)
MAVMTGVLNSTNTVPTEAVERTRPGLTAGWSRGGSPMDWVEHVRCYGPLPGPRRAGRRGGDPGLIRAVEQAGLRGRGGAWFPTHRKLAEVAAGRRPGSGPPLVVANGCEGDPASSKDHALLGLAPHLVLDGIELAARAVGAPEAVLCMHRDDPLAELLRTAIAQRPATGPDLRVVEVPVRYVASVDTSLVNFLTTGTARPLAREPRPSQRGVDGRPTLVDNVETLAHLALIARRGPEWFRARGTEDAPGTALITVGGAVRAPGVYEIDLGAPLGHPLRMAGGTLGPVPAVLLGGLGGRWLPLPAMANLALTDPACRDVGARLGIASLIVLPVGSCGLASTATVLRYLAAESAGQCGPCMFGLPAIADGMDRIAQGTADPADLHRLRGRLGVIPGRGACAHPDGAAGLAASALEVFAEDLARHLAGQPCPTADQLFPLYGVA